MVCDANEILPPAKGGDQNDIKEIILVSCRVHSNIFITRVLKAFSTNYELFFRTSPRSSVWIEQRFPKPLVARSSRAGGIKNSEKVKKWGS